MDNSNLNQIYRDNAWRHFAIHADQRLKMFQFYITISTALLGGGILLFRTSQNDVTIILLSFLACFFSFVFWRLEARTRVLVQNAEDAIKYLDESIPLPHVDGRAESSQIVHARRLQECCQRTYLLVPLQLPPLFCTGICRNCLFRCAGRHLRPHRVILDDDVAHPATVRTLLKQQKSFPNRKGACI